MFDAMEGERKFRLTTIGLAKASARKGRAARKVMTRKNYSAELMTTLCDRMLTERDPERVLELAEELRERLGVWIKELEESKSDSLR
jgi:hypothetical protein